MRTPIAVLLTLSLAAAVPVPAAGQPAPRPLRFADLAQAVAAGNLTLRAAAFDVAVAQAQLAQARGGKAPQVTVTGSYTRTQERPGTTTTIPNPFGAGTITFTIPGPDPEQVLLRLGVQYPLYTGGRLEAQIALAEANVRGAEAVLARLTQTVLHSAQQAYLQALLARENATAAQRTLEQAQEGLQVAQARVQAGVVAEFDALQAEVAVTTAQQGLVRARAGIRGADNALNALLNQPLEAALELADTLEPRPVPGTLPSAVAQALRARPELAELGARVQATQASIALAASGGRPSVALGAAYDIAGTPASHSGAWSATLSITLSLHDGGVTRERIREAELRLEQLRVQEAATRQRIELEVRQAWLALEQAGAELVTAAKAVEQAREAARIAAVRYEAGLSVLLEVLSAQATLAQAEFTLATSRFSQNAGRIQLFLAIGGAP